MSKTSVDTFLTPYETLGWADEAVKELKSSAERYLSKAEVIVQSDADSMQKVHKLVLPSHIPRDIARKLMEALGHIKNSFDQSVIAAICTICGDAAARKTIYFPWSCSQADLDQRLRAKRRVGIGAPSEFPKIPPDLWPIFRSFEPYPTGDSYTGGDDLVREMARIANRKHSVRISLVAVVAGAAVRFDYRGSGHASFGNFSWDPVKNEVIFARTAIDAEYNYNGHVALDVAFDEPGFLLNKPLVASLCRFAAKAKHVADTLSMECERLLSCR